ncbi:MAG: hypothetical protein ACYCSF_02865 [Acidimicrobiales bacterium]
MPAPSTFDQPRTPCSWFVDELAAELCLGERSVDLRCRRILLRLVTWATGEGIPRDREAIFDPAVIEAFCSTALAGEHSRGTHRSDLRRMARRLTKRASFEQPPEAMAWRNVAVPYSKAEVESLKLDALAQPTETRRRAARALLALGLGAGLDGRWVAAVGPEHLRCHDGHLEVEVGELAPRVIVVRASYEQELVELAAIAGEGCLVGRRSKARNRVADLTKSLVVPAGHPRLSPARLRATWLLWHLEQGTRLPELCEAAGLQGFEVLSDLLVYVNRLSHDIAALMLRGTPC